MSDLYDTDEWAAFANAVRANPADDLPRLVAADWLDEHGAGDRAEYIRVQCELARSSVCLTCSGRRWYEITDMESDDCIVCTAALRRRLTELATDGGYGWWGSPHTGTVANNPAVVRGVVDGAELDATRGFVGDVHCSWRWWLAHGPALLRREPVAVVRLTDVPRVGVSVRIGPGHPASYGLVGPGVPEGVAVESVDRLTSREAAAKLLHAAWGEAWGVRFELPPEMEPVNLTARRMPFPVRVAPEMVGVLDRFTPPADPPPPLYGVAEWSRRADATPPPVPEADIADGVMPFTLTISGLWPEPPSADDVLDALGRYAGFTPDIVTEDDPPADPEE